MQRISREHSISVNKPPMVNTATFTSSARFTRQAKLLIVALGHQNSEVKDYSSVTNRLNNGE